MAKPGRVDSSFLSYYTPDPVQPMPSPTRQQYAFQHPNARQASPVHQVMPPQAAYRPQQQQQQQQQRQPARPYVPNIQVSRPPAPPQAAFNHSPAQSHFGNSEKPGFAGLSPTSPQAQGRKGSAQGEEDDRYGSVVGSQNGQMDFWKRFSMTLHDKELEDKGLKKKQNTWLNKQFEGRRKYKIMIWSLTVVILIVIGATLAWHFTHNDGKDTQPSQHDFGLSPASSSARADNPLASVTLNAGVAKRTAIPIAHGRKRDRMHKQKRAPVAAAVEALS